MKKQFNIKPAQLLKSITKPVTKFESTNVLKFAFLGSDGQICCDGIMPKDSIVALPR